MKLNGEMIVALFCLSLSVIPLLVIGIVQFRSRHPVGFWSGVKPPLAENVADVRAYNRRHGIMWIVYSVGLAAAFFSGYMIDSSGVVWSIMVFVWAVGGILVMMLYHNHLEKKYVRGTNCLKREAEK